MEGFVSIYIRSYYWRGLILERVRSHL